jgi:hypothetical protein
MNEQSPIARVSKSVRVKAPVERASNRRERVERQRPREGQLFFASAGTTRASTATHPSSRTSNGLMSTEAIRAP